ncbi:hypothetical protein LTR53_015967, partial [Teratosphaeriaceae sp. CCFEE 6253]
MPSNTPSTRTDRRSESRVRDTPSGVKGDAKGKPREKTAMDKWVEPSLTAQPSYEDSHGVAHGVVEYMQPLGEAPNAKVKTRVRTDGPRKSVMGRSSAAVGVDPETPDASPAPSAAPSVQ